MAKIICPNKQYTGVSASVGFVNGIGETADENLIDWFKSHGYEIEEDQQLDDGSENPEAPGVDTEEGSEEAEVNQEGKPELTVKQIKEQLDAKGIKYDPRAKKDELLALLQ